MNKVILMGRLTASPELKHTASNLPVVNFTLAVNRSYVKAGGERQTDFIDIVCWRSTAEFVSKYFTKGQQMALVGALQVRNWEDKEGNKRRSYEVVAEEIFFADSKRDNAGGGQAGFGRHTGGDDPGAGAPSPAYRSDEADFEEITEDDGLPF